jgi:phospholipase/carboxylesterase
MRDERFGGLHVRITGGTDRNGGGDGPVVVLLHGFGAPGNDLVLLGRTTNAPPGTRFVFPEAPIALGGEYGAGRAWWHIDMQALADAIARGEFRDRAREVPKGLAEARALVDAMLDDVERIMAPKHLVFGGFSQGAMLSLDATLRSDRKIDALLQLSGTWMAEDEWEPLLSKRRGLPVLLSHGKKDTLLPYAMAEKLRDKMNEAEMAVTWIPFLGGHEIPPVVLDGIGKVVHERVGTSLS